MTSSSDLRRRLQRLRTPSVPAQPGTSPVPSAFSADRHPRALDELIAGRVLSNRHGEFYLIEELYTLDHPHGPGALSAALRFASTLIADVAGDESLAAVPLSQLVFLDTETTGLAGGAGTFAFLVGLGTFEDGHFHLRQYFLRAPAEEKAMLAALLEDLEQYGGFVTFNGKTFDLPLLESRVIVSLRRRQPLGLRPHLDLLHPARRLWRRELESCALGSLEKHVLRIARTEEDVPGALIPGMYLDFLRTGDATDMVRVIYHNAMDILSMVALADQVLHRFDNPSQDLVTPVESLSLARWYESRGRDLEAEAAYRKALADPLESRHRLAALTLFANFLKRASRRTEAVALWREAHELAPENPSPCVEVAKHFEWDRADFALALEWTQHALIALTHWPPGWRRDEAWEDVQRRLERLQRKLAG